MISDLFTIEEFFLIEPLPGQSCLQCLGMKFQPNLYSERS